MIKILMVLVVLAGALGMLQVWYNTFVLGDYFSSANLFLGILGGSVPIFTLVGVFFAIKAIARIKIN